MRRWILLLLLAPAVAGTLSLQQDVAVATANQAPFATLSQGNIGTATIGSSGTSASVTSVTLPPLIPDTALDITSTDDTWNVHAELLSTSGFGGALDTITVSLTDGTATETQIVIVAGTITQDTGLPVDTPNPGTAQLTLAGLGTGTLTLDLVLEPDAGGPALRYPVTITL